MKEIKISPLNSIITDDQETIDKAISEGLVVTDILDTNSYKKDGSDRPENIGKEQREIQRKIEQDRINETENKPNILQSLKDLPNNFKTEAERELMTWEELSDYHSKVVDYPHRVYDILDLKHNTEMKKTQIKQIESQLVRDSQRGIDISDKLKNLNNRLLLSPDNEYIQSQILDNDTKLAEITTEMISLERKKKTLNTKLKQILEGEEYANLQGKDYDFLINEIKGLKDAN